MHEQLRAELDSDLGLEGKKLKTDGKLVDAFYFCVGGAVGEHAGIARQIGYRAAAEDCPEAIERLLRGYLARRSEGENLRAYFRRTSDGGVAGALGWGCGRGRGARSFAGAGSGERWLSSLWCGCERSLSVLPVLRYEI